MTEQPSLEICIGSSNAPVLDAFMADQESFCSVIIGPLGSGKTIGCAQKALAISDQQEPDSQGIRPTRGYVIRNTYRDLFDTSIRDFRSVWDGLGVMKKGGQERPHFEGEWKKLDGTRVEAEVIFIAIDKLVDVDDLRGLQATWIWFNEMKELSAACVALALGRVGRFPEPARVAPTWSGGFGDSNAPDEDQWLYSAFEDADNEQPYAEGGDWTLYKQPGGVVETGDRNAAGLKIWKPNPNAENIQHLIKNYYARQLTGNKEDWISVNLANNYGFVASGQPVHEYFVDSLHVDENIRYNPEWPLLVGIDYGRTPAATVFQLDPQMGRYWGLWEFVTHNMSAVNFGPELARELRRRYPESEVLGWEVWGDPSGEGKRENTNNSAADILRACGIPVKPSPDLSNNFDLRQSSIDLPLKELAMDGRPRLIIHPAMKMFRKGLAGRYQFKRKGIAGEERYHDVPDKNDYSHPCESGQYALVGSGEGKRITKRPRREGPQIIEYEGWR